MATVAPPSHPRQVLSHAQAGMFLSEGTRKWRGLTWRGRSPLCAGDAIQGGGVVGTPGCAVLVRDGEEAPKEKSGKKPPDSGQAWLSGLAPPGTRDAAVRDGQNGGSHRSFSSALFVLI